MTDSLLSRNVPFGAIESLRTFVKRASFWDNQPYGTRFYFGDGALDYIQRGLLESVLEWCDQAIASSEKKDAWIPVSERLPVVARGEEELVWVCWQGENGKRHVCDLWYVNRPCSNDGSEWAWEIQDEDGEPIDAVGWHYTGCNRHYDEFFMPFDNVEKIIAWMPISKPEAM